MGNNEKTYIRVLSGAASGKEVLLNQSVVTCGRHHENDLMLADNDASRHHCRFVLVNGSTYLVEDAGSSNGTYVNDTLVRYEILAEGDLIRIGGTLLQIASSKHRSLHKDVPSELQVDLSFDSDLVPENPTLKPVLSSSIESYTEVPVELSFFELETELDFVYYASSIASKNLTLESLCLNLAKLVGGWAGVGQALLVLLDDDEQGFSQSFAMPAPNKDSAAQSAQQANVKFNRGLVDRVLTSRLPSMSTFEVSEECSQKVTGMCVPIDNGQKLLGLIYVDDSQGLDEQAKNVFSNRGLEVLAAIGKQSAAAIENNRYFRSALADAGEDAVGKLTSAVSHRINNLLHLINGGEFLIEEGLKSNNLQQIADGWSTFRRTQSRIGQLSTNMALYCREHEPLMQEAKPQDIINSITNELRADHGEKRIVIAHRTGSDLSLKLDSHYFDRTVRNILTIGLSAAENCPDGQDTVTLETEVSGDWFVFRASFRHFDETFDLVELGKGEINKVSVEHGFLEILACQKILVSQGGSLTCSIDSKDLNVIEVRLPLVCGS